MAVMESATVTGPAKNLIAFAKWAAQANSGSPLVEMTIVTYVRGDVRTNAFIDAAQAAKLPVELIREKGALDLSAIDQLGAISRRVQPAIVQSHNVKSHLFVRMLGLQHEVPWIAFSHGYTATDLKDRLYNQADRLSLRRAFRAVTVCEPFARRMQSFGVEAGRIRIQHNSVPAFRQPDHSEIEQVREGLQLGDSRAFICVGRLSFEKGHADLMRAMSLLAKRSSEIRNYTLVIVGDGPERKSLEAVAKQNGIDGMVRFAGHQANIRPYLAIADFLVLPSHSEGSPNVILEAMAAGLPVAATAVGGVPEIVVPEKTGLLVPVRNPEAMAKAIEVLIGDKDLRERLGAAGRERALSVFSPEKYCDSIVSIYREALQEFPKK